MTEETVIGIICVILFLAIVALLFVIIKAVENINGYDYHHTYEYYKQRRKRKY